MANNNLLTMASLEVTMWRPTPQKPDIATGTNGSENGTDFTAMESFKTMFHVDPNKDGSSQPLKQVGGSNSAFEVRISHKKPNGQQNGTAKTTPREITLTATIVTSTVTKAAMSTQVLLWRPTPQRPDAFKTGVVLQPFNAYFLLDAADEWEKTVWEPVSGTNYTCKAELNQREYSDTERTLDLTITFTENGAEGKQVDNAVVA